MKKQMYRVIMIARRAIARMMLNRVKPGGVSRIQMKYLGQKAEKTERMDQSIPTCLTFDFWYSGYSPFRAVGEFMGGLIGTIGFLETVMETISESNFGCPLTALVIAGCVGLCGGVIFYPVVLLASPFYLLANLRTKKN